MIRLIYDRSEFRFLYQSQSGKIRTFRQREALTLAQVKEGLSSGKTQD